MSYKTLVDAANTASRYWSYICSDAKDATLNAHKLHRIITAPYTFNDVTTKDHILALQAIDFIIDDYGVRGAEPNAIPKHIVAVNDAAFVARIRRKAQ